MRVTKALVHAEDACSKMGVRLTDKRKKILTALLTTQKAMSAYDIVNYVRDEYHEVMPAMSVYRILDFLAGENLVHKLYSANKYIACAHISCAHAHEIPQFLICSDCGQVKEIGISAKVIEVLKASVSQVGYFLKSPQLELDCLCQSCSAPAG